MFARTRPAAVADTLPWAAFLATTLAMLGSVLLHARWLPASLLAAFVLLLGLRVALRWRGVGRIALWQRLLVVLGLVALVASTLGNLFGREAGSALLAAMLVSKLLETDTRRDARIVLTVVAFLAMAGFLFDQGMLQAAMTAGVCLLMLAAMYELDPASAQQAQRAPHRAFSSAGMREAARHLALAIPFALVCFFLFPRLSAPMWGAPQDAFTGRTGISDTMEPGALAGLALDDSVAMRVRFDGEAPPPAQRYWRGLVLWNFDGRVWGGANLLSGFRAEPQLEPLGPTIGYEITLEPTDKRWLFLLDAPLGAPDDATLTGDFQARAARPVTSALRYRGQSSTSYRMQADLPRGVRTLGLRLPAAGNPRARAMAQDWRTQVGDDPRAIADLALRSFNQTFSYSFEVPLLGGDPIDDFLFEVRSGWCEHYASAFVFLMRAAGVPARVVIGFQGGYYNLSGNYYAVRRSDAHAWTEIWIAGEGWVRVDPTAAVAPERVSRDARQAFEAGGTWYERGWLAGMRDRVDLVGYWWTQAVVQFSAIRQRSLLEDVGIDIDDGRQLAFTLLGAAVLALALAALVGGWRRRVGRDPLRDAWRDWCARLAKAGIVRAPAEGPQDFGARAAAAMPTHADAILSLTHGYVALRYALIEPEPGAIADWRQRSRAFRVR
jgi:transglutaminase-like putative cysteine protease